MEFDLDNTELTSRISQPGPDDLEEFPLTYPQRGVWYLEKINPETGIGNLAVTLKFSQVIDFQLANLAVNLLLRQNEGFRIRIRENTEGEVSQYFAPYEPYTMPRFDFSLVDREVLYQWDRQESRRPFDFNQNLYYFAYLKLDSDTSAIYMRFHHLISDAWSFVQIGNDLMAFYDRLREGQTNFCEPNPPYRDYIRTEQQYICSERYRQDQEFWRAQFAAPPTLTTFKTRTAERIGLKAKRRSYALPEKLTSKIREYCQENHTSIFALFFAAMSLYINRIKDQEDIILGTPVLNRSNIREKRTVGMFISTVPLRIRVDNKLTFREFSRQVDATWFSVLKHQKYPFDHLLRDVREQYPEVDRLYEIAISYQNGKINRDQDGLAREAEVRWHFTEYQSESLYLHINEREGESQILLNYDYLTDLFCAKEIDYIHDHLLRLLWHALDNPGRPLSQIHMLSEKERKKVLVQFNQTDASYPRQATVISLFEDQVDRRPDAVAVEIQSRRLTYLELEHLAEAIAGKLKACQAGRETIVALYMQPSLTMIASILGVIKAGAAYLPIDPDYPADRVRYMLENSGTRLVLTATGRPLPVGISCTIIRASEVVKQALQDFRAGMRLKRSPRQNQPQDLLYIIYTSGSTGRPKGVMIEHRNVVRLLFNDRSPFDFDADDVWTMFHSYCFDFSVWEMYGALLNGGKLILVPKMIARDPARFRRLLVDQHVTILNQTPAAFYNLIEYEMTQADHGLHLRMVIFGGDALKPPLLRPFRQAYSDVRLINMYGITETTVHVTYIELNDMDLQNSISNVGRPIPTMRVYILDKNLNPVPIGTPGEIFVSGDGVGRGYLNNPELTQARFIPNPYEPGQIMYRSGDLGRFFPLGDIEYLGRIDQQVKIRGHRIELGEIETALLEYGKIRTARVLTTENNQGNRQLIAYYVPEEPLPLAEVRQYLARQLPEYMVPAYLIALDQIPLNSNGKIAREKLPQPNQAERTDLPSAEPESDLEKQIARAFGDVLGRTQISLDDDFFRLGGDSLSAARLVAALNDAVTFADLYTAPTVRELAERMQNREVRSHTRDEWLVLNRNPAANIHLIVFPFAGGSPASFIRLSSHLAALRPEMAMYAINLPAERQPQTMLAERLAAIIQADLQGDLYFYSHCAGSSLAVQTALQLERQGHSVKGLMIGASLSALPADLVRNEAGTLNPWFGLRRNLNRFLANPWRRLNDQALLRVLRRLGLKTDDLDPEFTDTMIRLFRTDAAEFYRFFGEIRDAVRSGPVPDLKLSCPIHCIVGARDPVTRGYQRLYRRWQIFSPDVDLMVLAEGRHYFLVDQAEDLARWISRNINPTRENHHA